ncbi:hypothetical protein ANSO36C_25820 [Nostoc cf. commune SO-36]|uniref:Uncharacterized protein n=1 Tax=Nostoc cf. commune SO-36 TaxID=449208 RepID=A0ABM7Z1E0_NOSCO|nr:hypothetical protein ANSO36C_25820 [Nostoc cf. commune SO-36]
MVAAVTAPPAPPWKGTKSSKNELLNIPATAKTLITTMPGCTLQLHQLATFNATIATANMIALTKAALE